MSGIDVTSQVKFGSVDDESLSITRCVCGTEFPIWTHNIGIYDDVDCMEPCPKCHRRLYFSCSVRVYEHRDEEAGQ